jgi:hypothetical protein
MGLIAIAVIWYLVAVKRFAVLPAPLSEWYGLMRFRRASSREGAGRHADANHD